MGRWEDGVGRSGEESEGRSVVTIVGISEGVGVPDVAEESLYIAKPWNLSRISGINSGASARKVKLMVGNGKGSQNNVVGFVGSFGLSIELIDCLQSMRSEDKRMTGFC